jgi:NADPH:quinone reductase-like Zn-dependent oxidoreductase
MRQIYHVKRNRLELRDVPEPTPEPGHVIVQVEAAGKYKIHLPVCLADRYRV